MKVFIKNNEAENGPQIRTKEEQFEPQILKKIRTSQAQQNFPCSYI